MALLHLPPNYGSEKLAKCVCVGEGERDEPDPGISCPVLLLSNLSRAYFSALSINNNKKQVLLKGVGGRCFTTPEIKYVSNNLKATSETV